MRIRPGDLAISIHTQIPANNGLIVKVVRPHVDTPEWSMATPSWWCTCAQPMTWKWSNRTIRAHEGPVPEACLFPIRGPWAGQPPLQTERPVAREEEASDAATA